MQIVIKAADISNPTRPLHIYEPWIRGVLAEFFAQARLASRSLTPRLTLPHPSPHAPPLRPATPRWMLTPPDAFPTPQFVAVAHHA